MATATGFRFTDNGVNYDMIDLYVPRMYFQSANMLYATGLNSSGQLGAGNTVDYSVPVQINSNITWKQVQGWGFLAGVDNTTGTICGTGGILFPDITAKSVPTQVGSITTWSQVSTEIAGSTVHAIQTNGTLWTWGAAGFGQQGMGDLFVRSTPVQVGSLTNWKTISSGFSAAAAIKTDNTLWMWGYGRSGNLGISDLIDRSSPVQVGSLTNWATVSAGHGGNTVLFTAAVKTDGTLWAWGANSNGQLGQGTVFTSPNFVSSPVQVGSLTNWKTISAGTQFWLSTKTDGTLWSCGLGTSFQHGNITGSSYSSPVQIGSLTNWKIASAGSTHAGAIKTDGTLWTWGTSFTGGVGQGSYTAVSSPTQVGSLTNWTQVSCGLNVSFFVQN